MRINAQERWVDGFGVWRFGGNYYEVGIEVFYLNLITVFGIKI